MPREPRFTQATAASRRRQKGAAGTNLPSPSPSIEPPSLTAVSKVSSTAPPTSQRSKPTKVTEVVFRSTVLERYGIVIATKHDLRTPFHHFGTTDPDEDPSLTGYSGRISMWYKRKHKHMDTDVWLDLDRQKAREVAEQYACMNTLKENEALFSYRGKRYFFKVDDIILPSSEKRINTTYFKLEWGPTPDGKLLHCPPQIAGPRTFQSLFGFTMKPDCTYWLTLCRMNPKYRNRVPALTYALPHAKAVAPYLTIEFKKDDQSYEIAENQLAASIALVLYTRVRLRCDRLQACNVPQTEWKAADFVDIKHYGIGFSGSEARFYVARPSLGCGDLPKDSIGDTVSIGGLDDIWRGCRLESFHLIEATNEDGVLEIQQWINEIHNWGLSKHSEQFVFDIKGILVRYEGGLNRVAMTQADMIDWGLESDAVGGEDSADDAD
ncbi:MAG: hypothetical protein Q9178_000143 [Gyalolechia marmorata]